MLRQLNVKRQLTIPAPFAKRHGFTGKGWVDVSEWHGVLLIKPVDIEARQTRPLDLSSEDWKAFNRQVEKELSAGKGKTHPNAQSFLADLRRRIKAS